MVPGAATGTIRWSQGQQRARSDGPRLDVVLRLLLIGSQVVLPFMFDQFVTAERLEWLQVAPPAALTAGWRPAPRCVRAGDLTGSVRWMDLKGSKQVNIPRSGIRREPYAHVWEGVSEGSEFDPCSGETERGGEDAEEERCVETWARALRLTGDPAMAAGARQLARQLAREDGVAAALAVIERTLRRGEITTGRGESTYGRGESPDGENETESAAGEGESTTARGETEDTSAACDDRRIASGGQAGPSDRSTLVRFRCVWPIP
eukprot:1192073-Prorocentrum_minimum.AAC.3